LTFHALSAGFVETSPRGIGSLDVSVDSGGDLANTARQTDPLMTRLPAVDRTSSDPGREYYEVSARPMYEIAEACTATLVPSVLVTLIQPANEIPP
jgi:hypothetical protein